MMRRLLMLTSTLSLLAGTAPNLRANPILLTTINEFQTAPIPRVELYRIPYRGYPTSLTGWTLTTSLGTATILPGHTLDTLHYTVIDPDSVSGTLAMNPVADSIILMDSLGHFQDYVRWPNWNGLPGPAPGWSTVTHRWYHWLDDCTGYPLPIPYLDVYWDQDASPTFGEPNTAHPTGSISGYVRRNRGDRKGIGYATVKAYGDSGCDVVKSLSCNGGYHDGWYGMSTVPPGVYQLSVAASGYDSTTLILPVEVRRGQNTRVDFTLSPREKKLPRPESPPPVSPDLELQAANPTKGQISVTYSLSAPSEVALAVFSLSGTKLRTLAEERKEGGRHTLSWDGKDSSGRPVRSGSYLLRLDAGDRTMVRKITLLK